MAQYVSSPSVVNIGYLASFYFFFLFGCVVQYSLLLLTLGLFSPAEELLYIGSICDQEQCIPSPSLLFYGKVEVIYSYVSSSIEGTTCRQLFIPLTHLWKREVLFSNVFSSIGVTTASSSFSLLIYRD